MFTRYHNWEAGRSFRSHSIDQDEDKVKSYLLIIIEIKSYLLIIIKVKSYLLIACVVLKIYQPGVYRDHI